MGAHNLCRALGGWRTAKGHGKGARQRDYNEFHVFIIMHKCLNGCKNYHKVT
jgi:hypothetical protein